MHYDNDGRTTDLGLIRKALSEMDYANRIRHKELMNLIEYGAYAIMIILAITIWAAI